MTRTSKALKRLGIAGLATVTIGAGIPAFFATAASAAAGVPATIAINPPSQTGAAGTCLNYTVTVEDDQGGIIDGVQGATVTVVLSPDTAPTPDQDVDFCTTPQSPEPAGNNQPGAAPSTPTNVTNGGPGAQDKGTFKTDANGQFTFGVISNTAGTTAIQAFVDANNNGTFDAGELQTQASAIFGAGGTPGSNAAADAVRCVDATPETDTNPVGEAHVISVKLTNNDTTGPPATGAPGPVVANSGVATCAGQAVPGVTPRFTVTGGAGNLAAANCTVSNNDGVSTCTYNRTAPSSDTIQVYVNNSFGTTGNPDVGLNCTGTNAAQYDPAGPAGACEATDTVTKTYQAAQTGNTVAVTCEPDPAGGSPAINGSAADPTGSAANTGDNTSTCTNINTDGSRIFTATVKNSAGALQDAILVRFTVTGDATPQTFECTTGPTNGFTAGECSVLLTDATPVAGEKQTVTATVRGTTNSGSATWTFTNAPGDARNVLLTPETQSVTPGTGVGSLTALVTDVDGAPVPGVLVTFTESGPGRFVNTPGSSYGVFTDASGKATVEVNSLSSESGDQTITVDITNGGGNQCAAVAGKDAAGATLTGTRAGAKAGNCTDTSKVTYAAASPSPSPSATSTASPTSSPAPGCAIAALRINTKTINATGLASVTVSGVPAGARVELQGYSQNHYGTANFNNDPTPVDRAGNADSAGSITFSDLRPASNTRLRARHAVAGCAFGNSDVINVRAQETLTVVRNGPRTYTFSGRSIPARPGGLIVSLYRIVGSPCAAGVEPRSCPGEVFIGQGRAVALGQPNEGLYSIRKTFGAADQNVRDEFVVKTGQDAQNAPGRSNARSLLIF